MSKKAKSAISPTRAEDYPKWYQQVVKAADLAEASPVRGCMVIKPWGYAIWERMQADLDARFKATGHVNAYFPLFIPKSYLEREAEHVEGFAKECAVVTHHRLEQAEDGTLVPAGRLEEPLVVRPTSETIIGEVYARWVQSYRDLPILVNQWANVVRWEMRTRLFLRTAEFLWQEGHTCHATPEEAMAETRLILDLYADFAERTMAMPVLRGIKTPEERFPGAVETFTIEAMMQDRKALQAGTSHFLGQNFSKPAGIKFLDEKGEQHFVWTTSWGVSTRLVGALIMSHSDDDGLVLPPRLAPKQVVIMPIYRKEEEKTAVLERCRALERQLNALRYDDAPLRVQLDDREAHGGKNWEHIKRGVPIRIEIGPRDLDEDKVCVRRRDEPANQKQFLGRQEALGRVPGLLDAIHETLYERARAFREANSHRIDSLGALRDLFADADGAGGGFAYTHVGEGPEVEALLAELKLTRRCVPIDGEEEPGVCVVSGRPSPRRVVLARAY